MAVVPETTVTLAQLTEHIAEKDVAKATRFYEEAKQLVADAFASAWRDVPVVSVDNCVYRVGRALRDADKRSSTGTGQTTATDVAPIRTPADPLVSSYPIIRRYVVLGL